MALEVKREQGQASGKPRSRTRLALSVALTLVLLGGAGYLIVGAPNHWNSYTDPLAGYSFSYPRAWLLATNPDGSHGSVIDPASRATFSVAASTVGGTPEAALDAAVPTGAGQVTQRVIAGAAAVEFTAAMASGGTDPATRRAVREVIVAARNSAGTTNLYTLALTQPATVSGADDGATFEQIVGSFAPAASGAWPPLVAPAGVPAPIRAAGGSECDAICWADANWSSDDYAGNASGHDCAGFDDSAGQYVSCDARALAALGDFQPDYQCSEFVARALAQDGLVPGLTSGGTGQFGAVSYNSYPFSEASGATGASSGAMRYNLLGVGTPGAHGLYDYLMNSGIGVNERQNLAAAAPGDVVFFYTGSIADGNREHVMLITSLVRYASGSQGIGGWDALVDGHNRAAYHSLLSTLVAGDYPFEVIHLRATHGTATAMATSGAGWSSGTDGYGQPFASVATTSGSTASATAQARFSSGRACELVVYVPNSDATALAAFALKLADGTTLTRVVDESAVDGWVLLYTWSGNGAGAAVNGVSVGNATGSDGQSLGVGRVYGLCAG